MTYQSANYNFSFQDRQSLFTRWLINRQVKYIFSPKEVVSAEILSLNAKRELLNFDVF
jgi:hypothetical protein